MRKPATPGKDAELRANQRRFLASHSTRLGVILAAVVGDYESMDVTLSAYLLRYFPHIKRALRQREYDRYADTGQCGKIAWIGTVTWKNKRSEYIGDNKRPRCIVDLKVPASLQGAEYAAWCKHQIDNVPIHLGDTCSYCLAKCTYEGLTQAFQRLISSEDRRTLVYFSDDSVLSVNVNGSRRWYNLDISACDMSHTPDLFHRFFEHFKTPQDLREAFIGMITANIVVNSVDGKHYMLLKPRELHLQSGITLTTVINDYACMNLAYSLELADCTTPEGIISAAAAAGYLITLQECSTPAHIQFLKFSPLECTDGVVRPILNLGVVLRASGTCRGELQGPTSEPLDSRARRQQTALMQGMLTTFHHQDVELLNPNAPLTGRERIEDSTGFSYLWRDELLTNAYKAPLAKYAFLQRYTCATQNDWDEFAALLRQTGFGITVNCRFVAIVMQMDYAMGVLPTDCDPTLPISPWDE